MILYLRKIIQQAFCKHSYKFRETLHNVCEGKVISRDEIYICEKCFHKQSVNLIGGPLDES